MVYISNGMITTRLTVYETSQSGNPLLSKLDIIIAGDFNIDTGSKNCNIFKQFADFCHTFDLTNLINVTSCFKSATYQSSLEFILTNRPRGFQKTTAITTGFSDYHKMITQWNLGLANIPNSAHLLKQDKVSTNPLNKNPYMAAIPH